MSKKAEGHAVFPRILRDRGNGNKQTCRIPVEFDALAALRDFPDLSQATDVCRGGANNGEHGGEHEQGLEHIGYQYGLDAAYTRIKGTDETDNNDTGGLGDARGRLQG